MLGTEALYRSCVGSRRTCRGVFAAYRPSLSATIFSTLKIAVELANAVSASYAIASKGLCR